MKRLIISVIIMMSMSAFIISNTAALGASSQGEHLERIKKSPNYINERFQNIYDTPVIPDRYSMAGEIYCTFFKRNPFKFPQDTLFPTVFLLVSKDNPAIATICTLSVL